MALSGYLWFSKSNLQTEYNALKSEEIELLVLSGQKENWEKHVKR